MNRGWFSRNWHWITIIGVTVISFLVYLGWKLGIATSFAVLSIFVSAFFAVRSLKLTQESLVLTRATTRPFLNIQLNLVKGMRLDRAIFELAIQNTGNLPADHVIIKCTWFIIHKDGHIEDCALDLEKVNPPIVFPSGEIKTTYLVKGTENVDKLTVQGSRVKVTAEYKNKLTEQSHTTRRTYRVAFASAAPSFNVAEAIVTPEEDYWD
jgi:hypothetical protein